MKSALYALMVLALGSTFALAQTTNQQNSPASNGNAGSSIGNTAPTNPNNDTTTTSRSDAGTTSPSSDTPREHSWGWIGILGLAGLAGLRNRNRETVGTTSRRAAA